MAKTHIIAVAGKGGVGKTTTCGMIIDYLCKQKKGPILVVDADANSNLNEVLGVEVETTLGDIREEMAHAEQTGTVPANMTKADYAEMKFNSALIEEDDYDMLVMGRTQGKGCYCFVNGVLKTADATNMSAITATWWWTTRLVWSISAAGRFRMLTPCFSFPTAPAAAFRPWAASPR